MSWLDDAIEDGWFSADEVGEYFDGTGADRPGDECDDCAGTGSGDQANGVRPDAGTGPDAGRRATLDEEEYLE